MTYIGSYKVQVLTKNGVKQEAIISPATVDDMPSNWTFAWRELWQRTDFELQNIIKLVYDQQIWGLIRYSVFPYPGIPESLEVEHLETNPINTGKLANRLVEPVGKWLMWYATQVSLRLCSGGVKDIFVILVSLDVAVDYYRDIIEMEYMGATTIAPGEDGYVFKFTRNNAATFSRQIESTWGTPTLIDS
ncbi:hypothetical protein NIES4071_18860 [Calothrix sp. NIES-4071]|nr:hypothetical protein NIES4071_18860 [Calothrix sp. NIES-4071]BAZ56219.1 hypothetical protein NIES4105_18810 [Calothrix sp. NIES-4105]